MPYVVTANCIVCKDLEGDDTAPTLRTSDTPPLPPEHLRAPATGQVQTTQKPDADDSASG
ncbi:hypothetical protein [Thermomonas sp.]|uniref:hypothetical protein n=1 Tax=Thermomonas sp. TaxID=1971895 RepID=UPI002625F9EE|nr:hypothetical protein [Thermomonas sp.]MCO5054691.1 hypothetical protein [Thermomonas sp.]